MKTQENFADTWSELLQEHGEMETKRCELEEQLDEVKKKLAHLDEVLVHLAPLAGVSYPDDIAGLGMTDAIRLVLEHASERMSAQDIRKTLENRGFDLSGYSAPMQSIYKILSRLVDEANSRVVRERDGTTVFYMWQKPASQIVADFANQVEISDDDIPF